MRRGSTRKPPDDASPPGIRKQADDHFDGQPIRTAPRDGTEIMIRVIHPTARYHKNPVAEGYDAWCKAHWIDHNGGGWTWEGVYGTPVQWRPLQSGANSGDTVPQASIEQSKNPAETDGERR